MSSAIVQPQAASIDLLSLTPGRTTAAQCWEKIWKTSLVICSPLWTSRFYFLFQTVKRDTERVWGWWRWWWRLICLCDLQELVGEVRHWWAQSLRQRLLYKYENDFKPITLMRNSDGALTDLCLIDLVDLINTFTAIDFQQFLGMYRRLFSQCRSVVRLNFWFLITFYELMWNI